jgi:hypothetical protein
MYISVITLDKVVFFHNGLLIKFFQFSECNHTVEINEGSKQEIVFPLLMPCSRHARCEWNIRNSQIMKVL